MGRVRNPRMGKCGHKKAVFCAKNLDFPAEKMIYFFEFLTRGAACERYFYGI